MHGLTFIALLLLMSGCTVNPVTGEKQLSLIPESQEKSIGTQQYTPTLQTQGGRYYLDPELTRYVSDVGQKLAAVSDRPDLPYEFAVINSGTPNAWALPAGKIAINRGLLTELDNEAQLAAVLGHEIVHAAARHSVQRMQQGMLLSAGMAGLGMALSDNEYASMIMGGAALGSQIALAQYSQDHELEADRYGMQYMKAAGYDPQAAVELQEIFVRMSEGQQSGFIQGLFATHPPSQARVDANRRLVQEIGAGGRIGRDTYQKRLGYLEKHLPAYESEDKAMKLAKAKKYDQALGKINEAIRIEPDEARFYAFRGQLHEQKNATQKAQADYDKAVSLYPEMFSYRIQRGLHELELNNLEKARQDLTAANQVVPTSLAFLRLGDIAVQQNRRDDAIQYYSQAAKSEGEIAKEAQRKLAALTK
ncbi:M48 family metalloprotease [Marinobacter sp.]|uniref:M48 family metalloprotease n=1 Tax=Marinobacter sp. TaxID=50741 RepID=UPI00384F1D9A